MVTRGESKKGRSGIVGVAALLHQKAAPFPWSSRLLYRGGGCARRAGREQPPTRSHRGPRAGLTDVPPPSRARGCHQGTGHRSCGHPHGSQAATQGRQRVSNRANPEMWRYCSAFIPAALGMDEVHWVRMHLGGCSWVLHWCSRVLPLSTHLSWDSDTIVMAG